MAFSLSLILTSGQNQEKDPMEMARREMVREQLALRDITDVKVLEAMTVVPRHLFVPESFRNQAYEDHPLPIGEGQTISQPYIVALMTQHLRLTGKEKVLEIGTGSGYQAAVLAKLCREVFSLEIIESLAENARRTMNNLQISNVKIRCSDGYFGWKEEGPFDGIIVTCASREIPSSLFEQLAEGGRLIIPLGEQLSIQTLTLVVKIKGKPVSTALADVLFVPMTGEVRKKKK